MSPVRYATRDDVLSALDLVEAARLSAQVDRALDAATTSIDTLCSRRFAPWVGTREVQVAVGYARACGGRVGTWREHLGQHLAATTITTVTLDDVAVDEWWAGPQNPDTDAGAAPYTYLDLIGPAFGTLALTGTFGACAATTAVATLDGLISSSATTLAVDDVSQCGVGALLKLGTEWVNVVGQTYATTGQALTVGLAESVADNLLVCADPTVLAAGETLRLGSELVRVDTVTAAGATVQRAYAGTVLAAHAIAVTVEAPRTLTVERGACGSTAATHADGLTVARHRPPGLVRDLAIAEALNTLAQETSSYARTIGSGDTMRGGGQPGRGGAGLPGTGLPGLREQVRAAHGRGVRTAAI